MRHIIPIFILVFILTNCRGRNSVDSPSSIKSTNQGEPGFSRDERNQYHFPAALFNDTARYSGADTFLVKWYSKHLLALKEPLIYNDTSSKEIYRFTWLRTFHNPVAIRFEKQGDNFTLYWKQCDGAGGYEPGKLVVEKQKTLNRQSWGEFINRLEKADFWKMKTLDELMGLDGSKWILEGKNISDYHVVDRWSPKSRTEFYKCCDYLVSLTDLEINGNEKY